MDLDNFKIISVKTINQRFNDLTFSDYYYRLMLLARSMFKWNNLPNGIEERVIEKWLYLDGRIVFYKDDTKGLMIARCTDSGQYNYYDDPTLLTPYGNNYVGKQVENGVNSVLIRNNDECIPTKMSMSLYAAKLTNLESSILVNVNAQKTPILVKCTDKQKLSLKQVYEKYQGNEPVIYADKSLNDTPIEVLKTDAPIVFDKLQIQKHSIWNEAMTFIGINNANQDKRERLVDDEVRANNEQVEMSYEVMLKARQIACEQINKMFGTNISVELRKREYINIDDEPDIDETDIDIVKEEEEM